MEFEFGERFEDGGGGDGAFVVGEGGGVCAGGGEGVALD